MYIFQMVGLIAGVVTLSAAFRALEAMWRAAQGTEQAPEVRALLRNFSTAHMRGLLATAVALAALVSLAAPADAQQRQTSQQTAGWSGGQVGGFGGISTLGGNFSEPGAMQQPTG